MASRVALRMGIVYHCPNKLPVRDAAATLCFFRMYYWWARESRSTMYVCSASQFSKFKYWSDN